MKTRPGVHRLAVILGACCVAHLAAQRPAPLVPPPPAELSAVPVDQEPRHRVVFANDSVRVIDALFPAFYVSQNHTHAADHVTVVIVSGRDDPQGRARVGFAGFAKGGYTHVVTNPAPGPMRFIDVELRAADRGVGDDGQLPGHTVVLNNSKVRITRVKLDPGQPVPEHQHVHGYLSVYVRGGDGPGTWKWHPSGEPAAKLDPGKQPLEIVEIQPK
jgi:hypothetical protein